MKNKIGLSKTRPTSDARPLGTPRNFPLGVKKGKLNSEQIEKISTEVQKVLALPSPDPVESVIPASIPMPTRAGANIVNLTFKSLNTRSTFAIYSGLKTNIRIAVTNFEGKVPTPTLELTGEGLLAKTARTPRVAMTAEERKAAQAAKPKPTLAERIAKDEKRLANLKAKAEAETAAAADLDVKKAEERPCCQ